jgi:hypothetical protein
MGVLLELVERALKSPEEFISNLLGHHFGEGTECMELASSL